MSSEPPGRYQSRLFNFLNRQSLRLTERLERAVRQLKVAAVWGAQILAYPVYVLVQASLSAGRQLSAAAQAGWPQLQEPTTQQPQEKPPNADTPIQRVLSAVNTLELQVEGLSVGSWLAQQGVAQDKTLAQSSNLEPLTSSSLEPSTQTPLNPTASESSEERWLIQGVASLLATRTLVLVTVQNEILDILTPQEQQKLSSRISWEVADLLRHRRIAKTLDSRSIRRFAALARPHVFLPVRLFWQVMGWVQSSPVAIAANLFQESTLVYPPQLKASRSNVERLALPASTPIATRVPSNNPERLNLQPPTPLRGALAFLDRTVADLESHQLVPGSEVVTTLSQRVTRAIAKLTHKQSQPQQQQSVVPGSPDAPPDEVSQTHSFGLQALIYAAIDYFFGRPSSGLPGSGSQDQSAILANPYRKTRWLSGRPSNPQPPAALPPNSELADAGEPDPWITWDDLFDNQDTSGKAQNSKVQLPNHRSPAQLPEAFNSKVAVGARQSIWGFIKRRLSFKQSQGQLSAPSGQKAGGKTPKSDLEMVKLRNRPEIQPLQPQSDEDITLTKLNTSSPTAVSSRTNVSPSEPATTALTTASSNTDLEPAPDWIETAATPTGYVKHPLEQLLGYVDRSMLWLEELVIKVWRWVQRLSR